MATFNKFGIFPVVRGLNGQLLVQKEVEFPSEEDAKRAGRIFAEVLGGAVAFRRMNDPDSGMIGQGVIIGKYGVMAEKSAPGAVGEGGGARTFAEREARKAGLID